MAGTYTEQTVAGKDWHLNMGNHTNSMTSLSWAGKSCSVRYSCGDRAPKSVLYLESSVGSNVRNLKMGD